jgi:hypothetical protein
MKIDNSTSKKSMRALKKSSTAALISFMLTSAMTIFVSTDAVAGKLTEYGPRAHRMECEILNGHWSRKRSGIYVCGGSYGNYSVYNFNKNTQRICGSKESCVVIPIGRPREEKPQSHK